MINENKFKEYKNFIDGKQRTCNEVMSKMHQLWEEGTEEEKEFNKIADINMWYLYYH